MSSSMLNWYGEQGAGLFGLKSYLFYLRKDFPDLIYKSRFLFFFFPQIIHSQFLGVFLLLDSLDFSNRNISSTAAL